LGIKVWKAIGCFGLEIREKNMGFGYAWKCYGYGAIGLGSGGDG